MSYEQDIKSLWRGKCTVTVCRSVSDGETNRTVQVEEPIYIDEPCRISYTTETTTERTDDGAHRKKQSIVLFVDKALSIPPGSKITVTQNDTTAAYEMSGAPSVYSHHQQINLDLFGGWA